MWRRNEIKLPHLKQLSSRLKNLALTVAITSLAVTSQFYIYKTAPSSEIFIFQIIAAAAISRIAGATFGLISTSIFIITQVYFLTPIDWGRIFLFSLTTIFIVLLIENNKYFQQIKKARKKEGELTNLISAQQEKYAKAQSDIKSRDEFLSIISHELKTPLTTMLLEVQQALYNIRNVSLANFSVHNLLQKLEDAEQQTKKLSKMINDLLNASLITSGKFEIEREKLNLVNFMKNEIKQVSNNNGNNHQKISFAAEDNIVGYWDKVRLEQAITNILSNAIKYGQEKQIDVTIKKAGKNAQIIIEDRGVGIEKDEQTAIFSKFHRATKNNHQGLGIGLYITNQIINAHHGSIKVRSKPQKGSTFTIDLPINSTSS